MVSMLLVVVKYSWTLLTVYMMVMNTVFLMYKQRHNQHNVPCVYVRHALQSYLHVCVRIVEVVGVDIAGDKLPYQDHES